MRHTSFVPTHYYKIIGIGTMEGDDTCEVSGTEADGYLSVDGFMMPVNLSLFSEGIIGDYVTLIKKHSNRVLNENVNG